MNDTIITSPSVSHCDCSASPDPKRSKNIELMEYLSTPLNNSSNHSTSAASELNALKFLISCVPDIVVKFYRDKIAEEPELLQKPESDPSSPLTPISPMSTLSSTLSSSPPSPISLPFGGRILCQHHDRHGSIVCPQDDAFRGVVLFVDVSGFTPLTEALSKKGSQGAELMRDFLSSYFTQLLEIVNYYGGDVIKFAGDALMILWKIEDSSEVEIALNSLHCGLDLINWHWQNPFQSHSDLMDVTLKIKIGVGMGELFGMHLGGVGDRIEFVLAGQPLEQMAKCEHDCLVGQLVISPEMCQVVAKHIQTSTQTASGNTILGSLVGWTPTLESWRDDELLRKSSERVKIDPADDEPWIRPLRCYVPASPLTSIDAGSDGNFLANTRTITTLFIHICGVDTTSRDCKGPLQDSLVAIQNALKEYEGDLRQFIIDDKGAVGIGVFGLPYMTHEDDAVRGVLAAIQIKDSLAQVGEFGCSIGITTGRAFCGIVGSSFRCEYAMLGDSVNTAARLMVAAAKMKKDGMLLTASMPVLCDSATKEVAESQIIFEAMPPMQLKGKVSDVFTYKPVSRKNQIMKEKKLFGYRTEVYALEQAMREWRNEKLQPPSAFVLVGSPGSGKTTLMEHMLKKAQSDPDTKIEKIKCTEMHQNTPYFIVSKLLFYWMKLEHGFSSQEKRRAILSYIINNRGWISAITLLNPIFGTDFPITREVHTMDASSRHKRLKDILLFLVEKSSKKGVIGIDDVQWCDPFSLEILGMVLENQEKRAPKVLFLFSSRPNPLPWKMPHDRFMHLTGVPEDATISIAENILQHEMDEGIRNLIWSRTQGHPFFVEAFVQSLVSSKLIELNEGVYVLSEENAEKIQNEIPSSLEKIITMRLDKLPHAKQLLLKAASVFAVIGSSFCPEAISFLLEEGQISPEEVLTHLFELKDMELVVSVSQKQYQFYHALLKEVIYSVIPFSIKEKWHEKVAEWLTSQYRDDPGHFPLIAFHYKQARMFKEATSFYEKAGDIAFQYMYSHSEVISHLTEAIDCNKELPSSEQVSPHTQCKWHYMLCLAYYKDGRFQQSVEHALQCWENFGFDFPKNESELLAPERENHLKRRLLRLLLNPDKALGSRSQLKEQLKYCAACEQETMSSLRKSSIEEIGGIPLNATTVRRLQLELFVIHAECMLWMGDVRPIGAFTISFGDLMSKKTKLFSRTLPQKLCTFENKNVHRLDPYGRILYNSAACSRTKDVSKWVELMRDTCTIFQENEDDLEEQLVSHEDQLAVLINALMWTGSIQEAYQNVLKLEKMPLVQHEKAMLETMLRLKCDVLICQGRYAEADKLLVEMVDNEVHHQSAFSTFGFHVRSTEIALGLGQSERAFGELIEAAKGNVQMIQVFTALPTICNFGEHIHHFKEALGKEESQRLLFYCVEILFKLSMQFLHGIGYAWYMQALLLLECGQIEKAKGAFDRALTSARECSLKVLEARIYGFMGRVVEFPATARMGYLRLCIDKWAVFSAETNRHMLSAIAEFAVLSAMASTSRTNTSSPALVSAPVTIASPQIIAGDGGLPKVEPLSGSPVEAICK
eukprot:TRINITY_DN1594_c0_g1_i4.p1 TRINITY_DN1594_c0_g1~~TRINITY_DN1594_c0_g1_i4.p1  ORF type:complete len:1564 (+),score=482.05 TRINITY_DN1594_c0_g1_i4:218-4909(+)